MIRQPLSCEVTSELETSVQWIRTVLFLLLFYYIYYHSDNLTNISISLSAINTDREEFYCTYAYIEILSGDNLSGVPA